MRQYIYLLLVILTLGCVLEEPDRSSSVEPLYTISTGQNTTARRVFDQCALQYSFQNSARTLDVSTILKQLEIPFDRWAQANGYLSFERVSTADSAEIRFVFADQLPLKQPNNYTDFGLIGQPISGLSQLVRKADSTCTVYLLNTHDWNPAELQRVLLFQIGTALGLANSSRTTSAMWPQLNATAQPDSQDASAIQQLYNQPCDRWTRLADLPFNISRFETAVASVNRGYVFLNAAQNNAFWEFNPTTKAWTPRSPYPTSQFPSTPYPTHWLAMAIDSTVFIGESYNTSWQEGQKGAFWRYVPPDKSGNERWVKLDSLPQLGWGIGYSFALNKIGYVMTRNKVANEQVINVSTYDPVLGKWAKPTIYKKPANFDFDKLFPFILRTDAYLVASMDTYYKSWRFSPGQSPTFAELPSLPGNSYITAFSVRNAGYATSGGSFYSAKNVWQYKPEQGWKRMKDMAAEGNMLFSFTVSNRAYVGTSTGQFWEYRP